jgi:ribosomal protein S12 methylthiotransferase accessory factor
MVFMPYSWNNGGARIVQPVSTGLACHVSPTEAVLGGLCEVIERDAFMLTWQARMSHPHIRIETLSDANLDLVQRFERTGIAVKLLDITLDTGVPTIMTVLQCASPQAPPLVFATSAAPDPEGAVRKSLEEAVHTLRWMQIITRGTPRLAADPPHYATVVDQKSHLNFWCDRAHAPLAEFVFASNKRVDFQDVANAATGDPARDLEDACKRIQALGHQVLVADLTTPDVADLGISVVRVLVPAFQRLQFGFRFRPLGGTRLWQVPQKLGHLGITPESGDNPLPHPFP